ncbi:MAG: hypothetical protein NVS1B10_06720 [Candidatus Saccharimonadales bacterium]
MHVPKNSLAPVKLLTAQSLASSFNSPATTVQFLDNVGYQVNISTTNSVGTFAVQGSLDNVNWANLSLSGTPSVGAANDTIIINVNQFPFQYIRLAYASTTAGTGTCDVYIEAKALS